jgi:hypothetical protein
VSNSLNNASSLKIGGNTPVTTPKVTGVLPPLEIYPKRLGILRVTGVLPTCYPPKVTTPPLYKSGGVTGRCCQKVILARGIDRHRAHEPWNPYAPHTNASGVPLPRVTRSAKLRSTVIPEAATRRMRRNKKASQ